MEDQTEEQAKVKQLEAKVAALRARINLLRQEFQKQAQIIENASAELAVAHRLIGRYTCAGESIRRRGAVLT